MGEEKGGEGVLSPKISCYEMSRGSLLETESLRVQLGEIRLIPP